MKKISLKKLGKYAYRIVSTLLIILFGYSLFESPQVIGSDVFLKVDRTQDDFQIIHTVQIPLRI